MESDCVAARYDSTGDDVVTIEQRTSDGFADTIDVHRGSSDECDDEANCSGEECRNHQGTEPTDIETVVGGCYPLAKRFPSILGLLS